MPATLTQPRLPGTPAARPSDGATVKTSGSRTPSSPANPSGLVGRCRAADRDDGGALGWSKALNRLLVETSLPGMLRAYSDLAGDLGPCSRREFMLRLGREIAELDGLLSAQVNALLHHPRFQQLEASWRGLGLLVSGVTGEDDVQVRLLDARKSELYKDLDGAVEFDQSELFRKLYRDEFKMPGGKPFGVLIGDYEFGRSPEDIFLLSRISEVAALSFCPFIAGASPGLLGLRSFSELEPARDLAGQVEGSDWQRLRQTPEAMFLGLTLPHILLRLPYGQAGLRHDGFDFQEASAGPDASQYLWGNAAYAFGRVLIRAYSQTGWLAQIRGVTRDKDEGGLVTELPAPCFDTDRVGLIPKCPTDLPIVDTQERDLTQLGLIPLCDCQGTEYCAFYTCPSLHQPRTYAEARATANARISAMLQYVLCAARFAHYLNVIARDWIGDAARADEIQNRLNDWLQEYVLDDPEADPELKAERPLRAARCEVWERRSRPGTGAYDCIVHLQPHYQLDAIAGAVELKGLRIDQTARPAAGLGEGHMA